MTNTEKFKEVYGFEPKENCIMPTIVCLANNKDCNLCPYENWWKKEFKPLKE